MNWKYLLLDFWSWIVDHGLTLAAAIIVGILIPRIGRLIVRIVTERMTRGEEQTKSQLALVGALVYILEVVAYFFVIYTVLTNLGVSTVGAAVPATVVSAAIGFGAQTVIGDFLSGFFIISEHQYGVGDTVSFDGVSEQVMGTVVRLTLRSTQIRTANGELITVPNSQASVTINYSQQWSSAVVDLDIPMTDDDTMTTLSDTVAIVSERAIDTAGVREDILGEVTVMPAMSITAPTAAGVPWSVGMRVTVDVAPATQWKVQRAIRAALINEFWDRFQAPGDRPTPYAGPPTQEFPPVTPPRQDDGTADASKATEAGEPRPLDDTDEDATTVLPEQDADNGDNQDGKTVSTGDFDAVAADVAENGIWRNIDTKSKFVRVLSLGGRIRPSSAVLLIAIIVLAILAVLSTNPSSGSSNILSPDRWAPATTTSTTEPTTEAPAPQTAVTTPETGDATPTEQDGTVTDDSTRVTGTDTGTGTASPTTTGGQSGEQTDTTGDSSSQTEEPSNPASLFGFNRSGGTDSGDTASPTT
ncbi:mechanosensitive ion channel family protein [Corynebacterium variabile]|uniref:mechanosensitive ion channel family protein n=1 Tax=Corynebacterium variabile TaxID=1727 RepID=UPI003FD4F4FD